MNAQSKPILNLAPPFTRETAILKVRLVEDKWNSRDPEQVASGYAED
jgi:nuclear transport factor 2 (NTF2) superfamily protein